ncbi:hypothetical protein DPEC_G00336090 [Dallia pectoralis]|uniref:Uncharacterized protein n=1 Tax=Dallia pectoralis TaxID=75939 RepID=A0ACC2F757_DALPE|nr:hypothetical protein DPEC_G00336090 [Dallia pectoralis]
MGNMYKLSLISVALLGLVHMDSTWAKRISVDSRNKPKGSDRKPSKPRNTQTQSYPRQPQSPNRKPNPYPAGGSYPGRGTNPNPAGSYPNQPNPGRVNPAGNPNQYPAGGGFPNQQYPGRVNPAGNPNQYPAGGGFPNQQYPGRVNPAGNPNQYPAGGGFPNQQYPGRVNPAGNPNQYPAGGGFPNQQYPGRVNPAGNPNQYPAGGGFPNQQYPGGYPVRGGNTGQGFGQAGGYPGGGMGGGYQPNWNPNNQILSPRYGHGGGYGGMGGGSPFSRSVQGMGYNPSSQSKGFAKKALMAAGVGAVAGMAIGYGLGRFPRPNFNFRSPQEEQNYNNYMYKKYGERSTDENDYGRDYTYKVPPETLSYDSFMDACMKRNDPLQDQDNTPDKPRNNLQGADSQNMHITPEVGNSNQAGKEEDDGPTVSIEEIGYPALVEQLKNRKCVEQYLYQSEQFLVKQTAKRSGAVDDRFANSHSSPLSHWLVQMITTLLMLLSSTFLLQ